MPMANGMLVTSPFRLQWVKYKIQKCDNNNNLCNSPFYFGASLVYTKNRTNWQCWFAKQPSLGGGQWHIYCHGPQFYNLLW
jgi:hypothetical protein